MTTLAKYAEINPSAGSIDRTGDELVAFVPMAAVSEEGRLVSPQARHLSEVVKGYTYFERNDVLMAKITPCMENGKAVLLDSLEPARGFGSTEFHVLRAKPGVDARFLFYLVWNQSFRAEAARHMTGTAGQKRVPTSYLKTAKVPDIDPPSQRRIADILDKVNAIRQKRKDAIALTKDLLRSAFVEMIGSLDKSKYPILSLRDCCEHITDGAHLTPTYVPEGVPFLRVTDIQGPTILWDTVKRIPRSEHVELTRRWRPERGDVLYSKNGTIGIPRLVDWDEEFSFFVSLCLLKPRRDILRGEFLASFLHSDQALRQATAHSKTLTVTNLHLVEIRMMRLPVPPLDVQDEWIRYRASVESANETLRRAADGADALSAALAQKAFRGELSC
jgi:type I restriction enzyme S subunit